MVIVESPVPPRVAAKIPVVSPRFTPRVDVADHAGTPPTTERMLPVEPIVLFASVFTPDA